MNGNIFEKEECELILGALDTLASQLSDYNHTWTEGERAIYEEALKLLTPTSFSGCKEPGS
jgi:hypothetical protein